jgi:pyruvate/2-oxoglutarate dehydrogenase complex dihydrolipoamide dehydrogenase (E3) component
VWDLRELPARLAVLGGGSIGCELGQAFARLGAEVTVIESAGRILPREGADASAHVARSLARDGVTLRTGVRVTGVSTVGGSGVLALEDGTTLEVDRLLVAAGRRARTRGLGLDRAGVATNDDGFIRVDARLRTSNPAIWAAGDVTGHQRLTHLAGLAGSLAATNAVLGLRRRLDTATVPRVTYTDPEVATVGVGSDEAEVRPGLRVVRWTHDHVDRALAEDDALGFSELVVADGGRIIGGTIVGPRAGETLGVVKLAVRNPVRTRGLAPTAHAKPTYNDGVWNAAIADVRARLRTPASRRAVRVLRLARRGWVRSRTGRGGTG